MFKKATFFLSGILIFLFFNLNAQTLEGGFGLGVSQYKGDLNPNFNPLVSRPGGHVMFRYNLSNAISLKGQTSFMLLAGHDGLSNNAANKARDMSFEGRIWDYHFDVEYNFLNFRSSGTIYKSSWTPFLQLGFGNYQMQHFKIDIAGFNYPLPVLKAHHQALNYGFGIKKQISSNWNINFTFSSKYLFNLESGDKLDNLYYVSDPLSVTGYNPAIASLLPPNNHTADQYFYTGVTLSYVLIGIKCPNPRR
ncbi:DUF6089 family protein [Jiulongibacter sediminis]|uniref:DUF6089 domain-containing protein n=1 Tax=Jiulongibacter sediminis TaxID=1605367 RepID=A0A0P7C8P5_9BACT|nr:DUF6089 family protein [Jiulongibacter sediminis]KPM50064.1 hypothetical protein AFM12_05845 [Jiulongibacter sediminis]TBX27089.1 hypothetical protein TK44_05850 [Jiulongibacter sediminis]